MIIMYIYIYIYIIVCVMIPLMLAPGLPGPSHSGARGQPAVPVLLKFKIYVLNIYVST